MADHPARHLGQPAPLLLDAWTRSVAEAFGRTPLLVGSSLRSKHWRDVDIRLVLDDDEYERFTGSPNEMPHNPRLAALNAAFSLWGQKVTGLPIDFQFQSHSEAVKYDGAALPQTVVSVEVEWDTEHSHYQFPDTAGEQ